MSTWELYEGGAQVGPLDEDHVIRMLRHGIPAATLCRRVGEAEWRSLRSHAPFAAALEEKMATPSLPAPHGPPMPASPPELVAPAAPTGRVRLMLALLLGALALGVVLAITIAAARRESDECREHFKEAGRSAARDDWNGLRSSLPDAKRFCDGHHAVELADLAKKLKVHDDEAAAQVAASDRASAEARERAGVASFPARAAQIRDALKAAETFLKKKDLEGATPQVKSARSMLTEYKGTSVATGEAWRALDAQATELEAKVKPYLDKVNASLVEAQRQLAAEAAEDRRAGVKLTKKGFLATTSLEKLQKAMQYVVAGDKEGYALFVQNDPDVTLLEDGVRVVILERGGLAGGYVKVRLRGSLTEFWTSKEGLRDP